MGISAPKKAKEEKNKDNNNPKYLKDLLELSHKACILYLNEK